MKAPAADKKYEILDLLKSLCRGAANAMTKKKIALIVYGNEKHDRQVEADVDWLIKSEFHPVCSSCEPPMGFFYAESVGEMDRYLAQLESRKRNLDERIATVEAVRDLLRKRIDRERRSESNGQKELMFA